MIAIRFFRNVHIRGFMADIHTRGFMAAKKYNYKSADNKMINIIPAIIIIIIIPGCGEKDDCSV